MTRHYATTAHAPLLPRLKVLLASMRRHCRPFRLHVLAEGEEVVRWAREQDDVGVTRVESLLASHPELRPERLPGPPRNGNELACCWRWWFVYDLIQAHRVPITAIDADLMFFSSPDPVFEEIGAAPAAVLPHAFPPAARGLPGVSEESHGRYGTFNGGLSFWAAKAPARRMAELCREWSHADARHVPGYGDLWGDQSNLTIVQREFGAHVIQHVGAAAGPWNAHNHPLRLSHDGRVFFGGRPLVAFHYHALRAQGGILERFTHACYEVTPEQVRILGEPYVAALAAAGG